MQTFRRAFFRVRFVRCSHAALLAAIGLCALPRDANARQSRSVPVLGDLPIIGRLYQMQPITRVPILSDLPIIGRLYRFQPNAPVQPKTPGKQTSELPLVSLEAKSATLGSVIETLMDQAKLSYTLDPSLEKIPLGTLKLRKISFETALKTILKSTAGRATYVHEDGIYRIVPKDVMEGEQQSRTTPMPVMVQPTAEPNPKATVEILNPTAPAADLRLNMSVSKTDLYQALKLIFVQAKINYALDPALRQFPITAQFTNVPLRVALTVLLKGANSPVPLTYRVEDGVYKIVEKAKGDAGAVKP